MFETNTGYKSTTLQLKKKGERTYAVLVPGYAACVSKLWNIFINKQFYLAIPWLWE